MSLLSLPQELLDFITDDLSDPCDLLALRLTHSFFNALLAPQFVLDFPEKFYFEEYPRYDETHCSECPNHNENEQGCTLPTTECQNTPGTPCTALRDLHMPQYTYDALVYYVATNNHLRLTRHLPRTLSHLQSSSPAKPTNCVGSAGRIGGGGYPAACGREGGEAGVREGVLGVGW